MSETKLSAISIFAGAGGDTLGMRDAGIDVKGFIEYDTYAIQTHQHNFKDCKLIGKNIKDIPDRIFKEYANNIDIIFGGFPCQTFSNGGKKDPTDKRGFLYQELVRACRIVKPKLIIGENVKGLLKRRTQNGQLFINKIIQAFQDIGYNIKYDIFNMKDYSIPQTRQRVIIYGIQINSHINLDLSKLKPKPDYIFNKDILQFSLERAIQIWDTDIINLIPESKFVKDMENTQLPTHKPPTNLVKCYTLKHISWKKRKKPTYSCIIDKDDFARTIISTYSRMPRLFVPIKNSHGSFLRPYTITELQQLQGFPKDFIFKGNYIQQIKQIGNAVPPSFITYMFTFILRYLNINQ